MPAMTDRVRPSPHQHHLLSTQGKETPALRPRASACLWKTFLLKFVMRPLCRQSPHSTTRLGRRAVSAVSLERPMTQVSIGLAFGGCQGLFLRSFPVAPPARRQSRGRLALVAGKLPATTAGKLPALQKATTAYNQENPPRSEPKTLEDSPYRLSRQAYLATGSPFPLGFTAWNFRCSYGAGASGRRVCRQAP